MAEGGIPIRAKQAPVPKFEERKDFTVDITEICTNMKYKFQFLSMERIGDVRDITNWKETADPADAWFDHNKHLRKYAYYGEKTRSDSAVRNFMTNFLAIKTYEQRAAQDAEVEAIRQKYSERMIEIYNLSALFAYLSAAPGVTIAPSALVPFLNIKKLKKIGKDFKKGRKISCHTPCEAALKNFNAEFQKFFRSIKERGKFISVHTSITEDPPRGSRVNLRSQNAKKKAYGYHFAKRARSIRTKYYENYGVAFWDFRIKDREADDFVSDFFMKYRSNLCKLNPIQTGVSPNPYEELDSL